MAEPGANGRFGGSHQGSTYRRIELITGERRRRRWTAEEKAAILEESWQPGASISDVARRHGLNRNLLGTWRRQARGAGDERRPMFVPLRVLGECAATRVSPAASAPPGPPPSTSSEADGAGVRGAVGRIDIEIGNARVRISGAVDAAALRQVLMHLRHRP
jgi:transposase